jgi:hypothetical protein
MRSRLLAGTAATTVAMVVVSVSGAAVDAGAQTSYAGPDRPRPVFTIRSPAITESSSLAVSTVDPGLVYTTNDSGDAGTVYVLDASTGLVVGRTTLAGVSPLDVEAISAGRDGSLVVADIGDNDADHSTADVYRIAQPGRGDHTVTARRVELTYDDGPRDAESVLYQASTGRVFVVSKLLGGAKVYATRPHVFRFPTATLQQLADAPSVATDATFLPGDGFVVVRTYFDATVFAFPTWQPVMTFALPAQEQGESITAPTPGGVVWVGSEGTRSRVLAVRLPDLSRPTPSGGSTSGTSGSSSPGGSTTATTDTDDSKDAAKQLAKTVFLATGAGLALLLVVGVVIAVRRRALR